MIKSKKNEKDQCDSEPNNQGLQMRQFLLCSYTTSVWKTNINSDVWGKMKGKYYKKDSEYNYHSNKCHTE